MSVQISAQGWSKIAGAAKYAGVSERTFRKWLKQGLAHCRLESGTILVRLSTIDQYLESRLVTEDQGERLDRLVDEVMRGL